MFCSVSGAGSGLHTKATEEIRLSFFSLWELFIVTNSRLTVCRRRRKFVLSFQVGSFQITKATSVDVVSLLCALVSDCGVTVMDSCALGTNKSL